MKRTWFVLLALVGVACNGGGPSANSNGSGQAWTDNGSGAHQAELGEQLTVLLARYEQPGTSMQIAERQKQYLQQQMGWQNVYALHTPAYSELYWGRFDDPAEAGEHLRRARAATAPMGGLMFPQAVVTPVPAGQVGPPEWDLVNNPGAYSLLVAVFKNDPDARPAYTTRRQDAVEYARQLREEGYEAWYYHGRSESSVTLGSFGESAIETYQERVPTPTSSEPVLVERNRIVDPRLEQLQTSERFQYLAYNGHVLYNIVRGANGIERRQAAGSYPIRVESARR